MEYKEIGKCKIPVLGIGTWDIGGRFKPDQSLKEEYIRMIHQSIKLGVTHIDTSEMYGNGFTEEIIGKAISSFDRKKLFITSKVWNNHLNFKDTINALHNSLRRLNTDYLDLYLIHKPSDDMDLKGTMEALESAQNQDIVKFIGVSNFTRRHILEAQNFLENSKINAVQNEYNLLKRDEEVLDLCNQKKILFIAYRPLMKGVLAKPGISILDILSKKYKKTPAQISLNWLISKKQVVTIPKSSSKKHLLENLGALGWGLDKEDYKKLEEITQD